MCLAGFHIEDLELVGELGNRSVVWVCRHCFRVRD
jgi:hypothetical protein